MSERILAVIVSRLGGDVRRVSTLREWMERAAQGRILLELERRRGPGSPFDPSIINMFIGMILVAQSLGLAGISWFARGLLGTWMLAAVHAGTVLMVIVFLAGQRLLPDDDVQTMGWWPVPVREIVLARIGLLLKPALQATIALTTAPLTMLLVFARPPLLAASLLGCGLLLQTVGLVAGAALLTRALRRLRGPRGAQRLFFPLFGLVVVAPWVISYLLLPRHDDDLLQAFLASPPWYVTLLPSSWAPSWALLFSSRFAWAGVVASLLATFAGGAVSMRHPRTGRRGLAIAPMRAAAIRLPLVAMVETLLAPFVRGREGWLVRRLTAAHLRDDPHMLGSLAMLPALLMLYAVLLFDRSWLALLAAPADPVPVRIAFFLTLPAMVLPLTTMPNLVLSCDARAAWLLATAELHPHRLLAAQRGVARGLTLLPMLLAFTVLHGLAGTAAPLIVTDLALAWLVWDVSCVAVQSIYPVMPFSRPREGSGNELLPVGVMMLPVWLVISAWTLLVYEPLPWWTGKVATWALLGWLALHLRRRLRRKVGLRALPVEIAPPVKTGS
jgi:hypothetical protein